MYLHCCGLSFNSAWCNVHTRTIKDVSNDWTGIWNGMVEWKMVNSAVVELPGVSLKLLSHHRGTEALWASPVLLTCFYIEAWYYCQLIIRCLVIVILQCQTLTRKANFWLHETTMLWTKMWWQKLVLDQWSLHFDPYLWTSILGHS